MGGPPPFGYKKSKTNKLILDKEQSEWVERSSNGIPKDCLQEDKTQVGWKRINE